jgi:hypothetical protein
MSAHLRIIPMGTLQAVFAYNPAYSHAGCGGQLKVAGFGNGVAVQQG